MLPKHFKIPANRGRTGVSQAVYFEDDANAGSQIDAFAARQAKYFAVVKRRIQVLHPERVNRTVEDHGLP